MAMNVFSLLFMYITCLLIQCSPNIQVCLRADSAPLLVGRFWHRHHTVRALHCLMAAAAALADYDEAEMVDPVITSLRWAWCWAPPTCCCTTAAACFHINARKYAPFFSRLVVIVGTHNAAATTDDNAPETMADHNAPVHCAPPCWGNDMLPPAHLVLHNLL